MVGLVSVSVGITVLAWGQQSSRIPEPGHEALTGLMRAKLSSSQRVVEGLMAGDFDMIRKGGDDLMKICDAEQWRVHEDQVYAHYRSDLRRSAIKLINQADAKNLDGAAYTYMHSMTTCISCHEYCRNVLRVASVVPQSPVAPIPVTEQECAISKLALPISYETSYTDAITRHTNATGCQAGGSSSAQD